MHGESIGIIIIFSFMISMLSLMALIGWRSTKNSPRQRFHLIKRKQNLNFKKVGRYYIYLQMFLLANKFLGNDKIDWVMVFLLPFCLISLLLIYYFFMYHDIKDIQVESMDEFDEYQKQLEINKKIDERDKKLKKLLK